MASKGQQIDAISVGVGLDISQLKTDITRAKQELGGLATGKKTNIPVKLDTTALSTQVNRVSSQIRNQIADAVKGLNSQGIKINPRFVVSAASLRQLRTDVNAALKQSASQGNAIALPVKANIAPADVKRMLADIERQLSANPISIGLNWHWNTPPPSGATGGGGAPPPPQSPRGAPPVQQTPAQQQARTRTAARAAAPPPPPAPKAQPAPPQPASGGVIARPPRVTPPAASPAKTRGATPTAATPTQVAAAESRRVSIDTLRGRDVVYTPTEQLAHAYERGQPVKHRSPVTTGTRGARVAGDNMTAEEREAHAELMKPENVARRAAQRTSFNAALGARQASDSTLLGYVPRSVRRSDFPSGAAGQEEFTRARQQAERVMVSAAKARQINKALTGIRFNQQGFPNVENLMQLDPHIGAIAEAFLQGDNPTASSLTRDMMQSLQLGGDLSDETGVAVRGRGGDPLKGLSRQARARRRFGKTLGAEVDVDRMDQVTLTRQAFGAAMQRAIGVEKAPSSVPRRATSRDSMANRDRGFLNVSDREMQPSAYQKKLEAALGIRGKGRADALAATSPLGISMGEQLEGLAYGEAQTRDPRLAGISRLISPRQDKESASYLKALNLLKNRLGGLPGLATGGAMGTGGLIERLMKSGHYAASQDLNRHVGMERGGTAESGGAMLHPTTVVPEWVRRAKEGRLPAKDLMGGGAGAYWVGEHGKELHVPEEAGWIIPNDLLHKLPKRATGGPVNQGGTLRFRQGNRFAAQGSVAGAAVQAGLASTLNNTVTRVFVTNWPANLTASPAQAAAHAAQAAAGAPAGRPARARAAQPVMGATPVAGAPGAPAAAAAGAAAANAAAANANVVNNANATAARALGPRTRRTQASIAAAGSVVGLREQITDVRAGISEALQQAPARALSVAIGQIAQNAVGGRQGILERSRRAGALAGRAERQVGALETLQGSLEDLRLQRTDLRGRARIGGMTPELADALKTNLQARQDVRQAISIRQPFAQAAVSGAGAAASNILSRGQQLRAVGVGGAGIVAGTFLFSAAMEAAQIGLEAVSKAAEPAADALTGFQHTAMKVSEQLSQQIAQSGGQAGVATAAQAARIGLSPSTDLRSLTGFSQRLAGAQNLQQQVDFMRANGFFQRNQQAGLGTGFNNGPGAGIPLLNMIPGVGNVGQTPGVAEQLAGTLPENRSGFLGGGFSPGGPTVVEGAAKSLADGLNSLGDLFGNGNSQITAQQRAQDLATANASLDAFNKNVLRVSAGFGTIADSGDPAKIQQTFDALSQTGDQGKQLAGRLQALGKAIVLPGGRSITSVEQANQFLNAGATGASMFDPAQLLASLQNQLTSAVRDVTRQSQFQAGTVIPANFALQQAIAPQPTNTEQGILPISSGNGTFGVGGAGTFGSQFSGISSSDIDTVNQYSGAIDAARQAITQLAAEGEQKLRDLGVPQSQIDSVKQLGQTIADLRNQGENLQLAQQNDEYNRQLFLQKRTVGDLVGLEGKSSAQIRSIVGYTAQGTAQYNDQVVAATELGKLQRAQLDDQRAQAQAQLNINRREIEFGIALSRLSTPGSTPEERATRRHEADLLAQEQLAQLNRQQRITSRGFKIEDIGISRDAQDAIAALQQLQAGHALEIQLRGIDKLIAADQQLLDVKTQILEVSKDAGQQLAQLALSTQQQIEAETGQFNDDFAKQIDASLKLIVDKYGPAIAGILPPGVTPATTIPPAPKGHHAGQGGQAKGFMGHVNVPTTFTAGDAGGEQVVVIRNPRHGQVADMPGFSTMASGPVSINFTGDVYVRDDGDIDKIAAKVELALNRRSALLGLTKP